MMGGIKHALWLTLLSPLLAVAGEKHFIPSSEPENAGVALSLDDDLFSGPGRDRDYTGGLTLTISGARAARHVYSLDPLLERLDRRMELGPSEVSHALALGVIAFTPQDIAASQPLLDDRPYASLAFLTSTRRHVARDRDIVYHSSLTVGMLGLDAVGSAHRAIHRLASSDPLHGYDHQISAGGEPTVRYSLARQAPLGRPSGRNDLKWTLAGSAGTVTEASVALNGRWGHIRSPWWSFTPEQSLYSQDAQPLAPLADAEAFFTAGVRLRVRAYNAFLQGQFRHSEVLYSAADLNAVLAEAWGGFALRRPSGLEIRYLARWGSPEVRRGAASRDMLWGSLEFVRPFAPGVYR